MLTPLVGPFGLLSDLGIRVELAIVLNYAHPVAIETCVAQPDLELTTISGSTYKLRDWLTSYPLLLVALDPYTHESGWILDTAKRMFDHFQPADIRVGWICGADVEGCKQFLGPLANDYLTICDPNQDVIKSLELTTLPALVHMRVDGFTQTTEGWDPEEWSKITDWVATIAAWSKLNLGVAPDPAGYHGTPVS